MSVIAPCNTKCLWGVVEMAWLLTNPQTRCNDDPAPKMTSNSALSQKTGSNHADYRASPAPICSRRRRESRFEEHQQASRHSSVSLQGQLTMGAWPLRS